MGFRVVTLNLEQNHKRWEARRELIVREMETLKPDLFALNEVCIPLQTGRWLQQIAWERLGTPCTLIQQSKVNSSSTADGEALLTRHNVIETANLDYRTRDAVAQVVRIEIEEQTLDIYITHLYMSRGDDSLRLFQVQQLLAWIDSRNDVDTRIVCGDFNATLDMPSAQLMAEHFRPTQTEPTAFTPLQDTDGTVSHPYWDRLDRCIDYIWVTGQLRVEASGVCFNRPDENDPTLWPSDHAGVWADLQFV